MSTDTPTPRRLNGQAHYQKALARMVNALPACGSVVLVHSHMVVPRIGALIRERRGPAVAKLTRVFSAPLVEDEEPYARLGLQVFRDPFVTEQRAYLAGIAAARGLPPVKQAA